MNERAVVFTWNWGAVDGALTGAQTHVIELSQPWTFDRIKACASNDSSATITGSGGITIAEFAIGDSGDPIEAEDDGGRPVPVDADESCTFTLDHDGDGGTAASNVSVMVFGFIGEGAQ